MSSPLGAAGSTLRRAAIVLRHELDTSCVAEANDTGRGSLYGRPMRPSVNAYIVSGSALALAGAVMLAMGVAHRRRSKLTHAWCR